MGAPWRAGGSAWCLGALLLSVCTATEIPLSVQQVPTITKQPKEQVAFPFDEYFQIECEAKGNPEPTFTWTRDGQPFDLSDPRIILSNGSGTFRVPNEGHVARFQGRYRCFASNALGVAMSEEAEFIVPNVPKFPKEQLEPLEVEEGDPIVLRCSPPSGLPPLHIYWMNMELEHIHQDERVYMSQEGDLYFAHVEDQDSRSDYCCFAAFPRLRTIVQKMPMKLTVNSLKHATESGPSSETGSPANSIKQRKPQMLLPPAESGESSSVTVLKGEALVLECFAEGLPTPKVEWSKLGGDLPEGRENKENYGKMLKIENASYQDRGNYRCTATNALGSATHDFHVTVEEPPRWTRRPQSGVYSSGSSGILVCEAEGEPQPTITWRVNGAPLDKSPFASDVVSSGEISFTDLQPNHTAVYQCEATNAHGTLLASANVDVLDVRPLIETEDGESYAAVQGASVLLLCQHFASPAATVTWQTAEEAVPLGGPRFQVLGNGSLLIGSVREEDAGSYSCWVENAQGKAAVTASLDVRNATRLQVTPRDPRVPRAQVLTLHCASQCDAHLRGSLRLSWTRNGEAVGDNSTGDGRVLVAGANLTITNVTLADEGTYSCWAHTALDSASDSTRVTVLDVPDPPGHLHLSERQNRSVRLSWRAGDAHNSPISEYIIEFEGDREEPGRWAELTRVPGGDTSALLALAPYVRYQFRVTAVNAVGRSRPSRPSEHHQTPPAAPDRNPQNVHVQASQPKELVIRWEPLKPLEQNGPGLEYRVAWRPRGAPVEWEEETVTNHSLRVMTSAVYAPYEVQVQAVNQLGAGPEPQAVTLYSGEDYPDAAPVIHSVDVVNSTLARVSWSPIPKDRVHGQLEGYQVSWWRTRSLLDGREAPRAAGTLRFPGARTHGMVPALEPFSEFRLTVLAYNAKGPGPESEPYVFQTPEGVPEKPAFLKVLKVDQGSVSLSWGLPKKLNGNLTGYELQYQIINGTSEVGELRGLNLTARPTPHWRLSGLQTATKYKFYLRACTARGCGAPATEESATLAEGGKSTGKSSEGANITQKSHPGEVFEPGAEHIVRLLPKTGNNSIFEDVIESRGREHASLYEDISTQGWFIGLMCAVALLTLTLLTVCFVKRNRGGKYSVKEKEDLHPDPEAQSAKDETFGEYSDSDEKPLKGSARSLPRALRAAESGDSLAEYGEGAQGLFQEDGSFIGAYAGAKDKGSVDSTASSSATFPLRA
ncbi:neural cell adhesion molecule L1-like protein isoform X1 [Sorex araneus]|uniref:neural cell adhesion molecule L1-like protein isoform X1 n=1 Tax=Sorex araneus TaxID=42254 RepID=UPI002433C474|nr:neural cell adhesion molecule L1-like protein isoform X1 [Sorex araneus]XP_054990880.1 neural cell adhesion molecule L1-like protein isoform X1 [Sorex araneus]XP_054990881.1 neural cell adhesion molecule L1-like protein isoform X1 [Sorex araneus]XP_054990884.1 neural cell adhesion molecule L1-like protein isoform X1 [Sorex araneus]